MVCPGCSGEMVEEKLEAKYGGELVIDVCHGCHGFWFDGRESLQLSPGSVLRLFRVIHEHHGHTPAPMSEVMPCPRCGERLVATHDLIRGSRFSYFRCPQGHGRLTTFFQFLKEKHLVRDADPRQLAQLKAQLKVIRCSACGAPVELERTSVCEHCRAPISALDPQQVEVTLRELKAQDAKRGQVDPTLAARLVMDQLSATNFYRKLDQDFAGPTRRHAMGGAVVGAGLVEAGLDALLGLFDV